MRRSKDILYRATLHTFIYSQFTMKKLINGMSLLYSISLGGKPGGIWRQLNDFSLGFKKDQNHSLHEDGINR